MNYKKITAMLIILLSSKVTGQQGRLGINTVVPSVTLDVNASASDGSQAEGLKIPYLKGNALYDSEVSGIYSTEQDGNIVYVTAAADTGKRISQTEYVDSRGFYSFDAHRGTNGKWLKLSLEMSKAPSVSTLSCSTAVHYGILDEGIAAGSSSSVIPYSGGNGVSYNAQDIASVGVQGLTAHLPGGVLNTGTGNISLLITGTPSGPGSANFIIDFAGKSCILTRNVFASGVISSVDCAAASHTGILTQGISTGTGVNSVVSYTGGNGGYYQGQTIASTGVTGLTATLLAGHFESGSGTLSFTISGTPSVGGKAIFSFTIGGKPCSLIRYVDCGAYIAAGVWKNFLCHNLGADTSLNPHDMSQTARWGLNGAYIQWGRRGPNITGDSRTDWVTAANDGPNGFAAAPKGSTSGTANSGTVSGWYNAAYSPDYSWRTGAGNKTVNDPCPDGYRVPTYTEWLGVMNNNTVSRSGTWQISPLNYGVAIHFGPNASTKTLTLPAAGGRNTSSGNADSNRGYLGTYWSSTELSGAYQNSAYVTFFRSNNTLMTNYDRRSALPVRCIRE